MNKLIAKKITLTLLVAIVITIQRKNYFEKIILQFSNLDIYKKKTMRSHNHPVCATPKHKNAIYVFVEMKNLRSKSRSTNFAFWLRRARTHTHIYIHTEKRAAKVINKESGGKGGVNRARLPYNKFSAD